MQHYVGISFKISTSSWLICYMELPLFPNLPICSILILYAANMQHYATNYFLELISSSRLIFHVKILPLLNFQFDTTNCNSKNLYAAFQLLYAANMQHYAAICFFSLPLFLNWFVMWNHPYFQIFSIIQPIVEANTYMQHLDNFMQ